MVVNQISLNELKKQIMLREAFKKTYEYRKEFKLRKIESDMKFWANRKKGGVANCTPPLL